MVNAQVTIIKKKSHQEWWLFAGLASCNFSLISYPAADFRVFGVGDDCQLRNTLVLFSEFVDSNFNQINAR